MGLCDNFLYRCLHAVVFFFAHVSEFRRFHKRTCELMKTENISGKDLKKEINNCSCLFDLPQSNALRGQLAEIKHELEEFNDQCLG